MFFLSKVAISLACSAGIVVAAPANIPRQNTCSSGVSRAPEMYNLYPEQPDRTSSAVTEWHLETFSDKSQLEQAAVFKNIPAGATQCTLMWEQASMTERTFLVDGKDALVRIQTLSGFPSGKAVSYSAVKAFDTLGDQGHAGVELTGWDTLDKALHIGGGIPCAEEIHLLLYLQHPNGDTKFVLDQDDKNGLFIKYSC
ncbi:hypothetical protein BGZ63DRAFT_465586 [Mariannaea sp. PMI_226]|nr:hypothetical protein BGZ63DRAFT_465586 [Mariannaea sp. PMI_226]